MTSTYTTNIGIEKPATGDQSGTWGDTTNTNFDIIDEATNGIVSITLTTAGSSGSPNDLPITDGATSNGRNRFIEFVDGGDLGATVYVQLTPNNAEKIVHVRNSLSGSRSILIFQGTYNSSRDLEIPNGKDVYIKFNGGGTTATTTFVNANEHYTGTAEIVGSLDVDNVKIDGNTISTTDTNGNLNLTPDGTGSVKISSADNKSQLILESTDTDATEGPRLDLRRNSASPADDDQAGIIRFVAENDAGENINYSTIKSTLRDVTDGTEDAELIFQNRAAGTLQAPIRIKASEVAINDDQVDLNFRVESDTATHALFVDAGNDRVGIGSDSNVGKLLVSGDSGTGSNLGDGDTLISQQNKGFVSIENLNDTAGVESGITLRAKLNLAGAAAMYVKQTGDYQGDLIFRHRTGGSVSNETFRIKHDATAQFHGNLNVLDPGGTTDVTLVADGGNLFLGPSAQAHSSTSGLKLMASAGDSGVTPAGEVFIEDNAGVALTLATPNTSTAIINFADPEDFDAGEINYSHSTDVMTFRAASGNRMFIASDGVRIGANAAANALDDIEDGTFSVTATRSGVSGTDSSRTTMNMRYFKVGRMVFIDFTAPESSTAPYFKVGTGGYASGQSFAFASSGSNLPFTPKNSASTRLGKSRTLAGADQLGVGWRAGSGRIYLGAADDNEYVMHNTATTDSAQSNVLVQCTFVYYTNS
jgi:hypothetical protein